jgi:hypothetical protein
MTEPMIRATVATEPSVEPARPHYEPPAIRALGSAADLLAGGAGSCGEVVGTRSANRQDPNSDCSG